MGAKLLAQEQLDNHLVNIKSSASSSLSMSGIRIRMLARRSKLVSNMIILSVVILSMMSVWSPSSSSSSSSSSLVEAKRASGGSSLLTKKPPFNGSIFGKRSGAPPTPAPALALGLYDQPLYPAPTYNSFGSIIQPGGNPDYMLALYQQQQQQQQQEAAIARAAAINRCLLQREWLQEAGEASTPPSACDELLALVNLRSRLN